LTLGVKPLWNVVSGRRCWCKTTIWKKYFTGLRLCYLDSPPKTTHVSPIFFVCLKEHAFFSPALTWILGNGKQIRIWEDSIMGDPAIDTIPSTKLLKSSLKAQNINTLWDISHWQSDRSKDWASWNFPDCPTQLHWEKNILITLLRGKSLISKRLRDQ
jgi:hypothetical protein